MWNFSTYIFYTLNTVYEYGKLKDTMEVVELQHKRPYLNTVQKCHIYNN
jgi:hypothetical protein